MVSPLASELNFSVSARFAEAVNGVSATKAGERSVFSSHLLLSLTICLLRHLPPLLHRRPDRHHRRS